MCDNIIARLLIICKIQISNVNNCRFKCNVVIVPYAAAENCMISPKPPCIKGEADASRTQGDCPRNYSFYIAGSKRTERRLSCHSEEAKPPWESVLISYTSSGASHHLPFKGKAAFWLPLEGRGVPGAHK